MADTKKHIRVFLASPGDLRDERVAAKSMVDHINKTFCDFTGYHVDLVGWEDTLPRYGRAQEVINQDLKTCEMFVGMLWERWGTPPSKDGPYTSGFQEEFEIAVTNRRANDRPEICLFLKEMEPKLLRDPGVDTRKVIEFREKLIASKEIKYETFTDLRDFELKFERVVVAYIFSLVKSDLERRPTENRPTFLEPSPSSHLQETSGPDSPLGTDGAAFVREFLVLAEKVGGGDNIDAVRVARFRLLSNIVSHPGNDQQFLGVHDSNLLFAHKDALNLGLGEIPLLILAGLNNYQSENVPLWHWYLQREGFNRKYLGFYALHGTANISAGALYAMALVGEHLPDNPEWDRNLCLEHWFSKESQDQTKVAALNYLGECGLPSDLPKIKAELERGGYQTRGAALDAVARINLREGREKALDELFDLQPDSISEQLLGLLFARPDSISDATLLKGIGQRNYAIRRTCVDELVGRKNLPTEIAESLLEDSDADVRLLAIKSLVQSGKAYTIEEGRKILVRKTAGGLLNPAGTTVGNAQFVAFRKNALEAKTDTELKDLAERAAFFNRSAECALLERHFSKDSAKLLAAIEDRYKQAFSDAMAKVASLFGEESEEVKNTKKLENHVRGEFVRDGLDIVLRKSGTKGLPFVRKQLADNSLAYSDDDLEYLEKFGEWQDIPLIMSLVGRYGRGESLVFGGDGKKHRLAAKALHRIGKGRTGELLSIEMPSSLLEQVIHSLSDTEFRTLSDHQLTRLLSSEADRVRKVTALKCVRSFNKKRLLRTLQDYVVGEKHRYYNVIHWLDFGVSAPKGVTVHSASKMLAREWSE